MGQGSRRQRNRPHGLARARAKRKERQRARMNRHRRSGGFGIFLCCLGKLIFYFLLSLFLYLTFKT